MNAVENQVYPALSHGACKSMTSVYAETEACQKASVSGRVVDGILGFSAGRAYRSSAGDQASQKSSSSVLSSALQIAMQRLMVGL